jgi:hypothetical protein
MKLRRTPAALLFNPFAFIAGGQALLLGLALILLAGWIGFLSSTHFDGVLDTHTGWKGPLWFSLAEGIIDWLCLTVPLIVTGKLISRSSFRVIDLAGTQALARWPTFLISLAFLPGGIQRFSQALLLEVGKPVPQIPYTHPDALIFLASLIVMLPCIVWIVALMYQSFSISCNVRGAKAVWTFVGTLLLAEVLSRVALAQLIRVL